MTERIIKKSSKSHLDHASHASIGAEISASHPELVSGSTHDSYKDLNPVQLAVLIKQFDESDPQRQRLLAAAIKLMSDTRATINQPFCNNLLALLLEGEYARNISEIEPGYAD